MIRRHNILLRLYYLYLNLLTLCRIAHPEPAMASTHDKLEEGLGNGRPESGSDEKVQTRYIDGKDAQIVPDASSRPAKVFQAPERIRNMTFEERSAGTYV